MTAPICRYCGRGKFRYEHRKEWRCRPCEDAKKRAWRQRVQVLFPAESHGKMGAQRSETRERLRSFFRDRHSLAFERLAELLGG